VNGPVPVTATEKPAGVPSQRVSDCGGVVMLCSELTVSVAGSEVIVPHAPTSGRVQLVEQSTDSSKQMFIGVGEILDDGRVAPRRLVVAH